MISAPLAAQLDALRAQADATTVPSGLLAWWGAVPLPDGSPDAAPLSFAAWQGCMAALRQAALRKGLVPSVPALLAITTDIRSDGPLPISIAHYRVARPKAAFAARVVAAATDGHALTGALPPLADVLEEQHVLATAAPMHEQWALAMPAFRSRLITWCLDERFYCAAPLEPRPDRIEVDVGDGTGWRTVAFGGTFASAHPTGDSVTYAVRVTLGTTVLTARGTVAIGGQDAPTLPDDSWPLYGANGNRGTAWVYRASGHAEVVHPVIVAEGFPGGYAPDYLYEMMNQEGLLVKLLAAGHDVILLAFANGTDLMERNAAVAVACIQAVIGRTKHPLAVGGVSMGGLITRYALAWMERHGISHRTHLFFTIDTPHRGSATALAIQWFTRYFRDAMPMASDFSALIGTPANREFLIHMLGDDGTSTGVDPLRTAFLAQLENLGGYPQGPRRIAVSSGRGNGGHSLPAGAPLMSWSGSPFASATLTASGAANVLGEVGAGDCFLAPTSPGATLVAATERSWEGAPGGQNGYTPMAAVIAQSLGCGTVTVQSPSACSVPTISALDIDQDPFAPIPPSSAGKSPFHDYVCSSQDLPHITLSAATAQWLLTQLTASPAPPGRQSPP